MPDGVATWRVLKGAGVKYVKFVIIDVYGRPRVEVVPIDAAKDVFIDGVVFDGSSIPAYTTVDSSDLVAAVDPDAVYVETWNGGKSALVFTNVQDGGRPHPLDPRNVLLQVIDYVKSRGYSPMLGVEVEFFLVRGNPLEPADRGHYFSGDVKKETWQVVEEIMEHFHLCGLGSTKSHHEVSPGQYEVNIPAGNPLQVADQVVVFKIMARAIAERHGQTATFMPKPFWGMNGSGMHVHLSFWKDGVNLFASVKELTAELKYAVAGVLKNALQNSVFVAPTVNSYKRLVPHHEAPTRIVWGIGNRSVMVRIPYYGGRTNRFEYRHPDPSSNPYLAFAVVMLSALEGLERREEPPQDVKEVAYELQGVEETPRHLGEAVKLASELASESFVIKKLPQQLVKAYLSLKEQEWKDYLSNEGDWEKTWNKITKWEYDRYLETV
ncbi:MAG: glutamine synthetase family protein [Pyrobaculum sp.]